MLFVLIIILIIVLILVFILLPITLPSLLLLLLFVRDSSGAEGAEGATHVVEPGKRGWPFFVHQHVPAPARSRDTPEKWRKVE